MANFSDAQIQNAWERATIINQGSKDTWRQDLAGAWINRNQYGQETEYGWNVDHRFPESRGGSNSDNNLRAMHWRNNLSKSDDYPTYKTVISSDGNKNIQKEQWFKVQN